MPPTALSKALQGEKLPDKQQKGALAEAVDKIKNLGGRISRAKEVSETVAEAVLHTAETQGTVFAASFAEGYFGEDRMDVGPVDLRLAGGLVVGGYGLYSTMNGKGGSHALALGNGLLATGISRIGRNAGRALADKKKTADPAQAPATAAVAPAAPPPVTLPAPAIPQADGDFGDLVRDIFLTPDASGDPETAGRRKDRHRPSRFIRADAA
jgi:hypothetical protein